MKSINQFLNRRCAIGAFLIVAASMLLPVRLSIGDPNCNGSQTPKKCPQDSNLDYLQTGKCDGTCNGDCWVTAGWSTRMDYCAVASYNGPKGCQYYIVNVTARKGQCQSGVPCGCGNLEANAHQQEVPCAITCTPGPSTS